ncbi:MAG: hypothetical protein U0326_11940 [Polyangiales bacterium]
MQVDTFYLIEPRPNLAHHLIGRVETDMAELLLEPVLLQNREGGVSDWDRESQCLRVKITFLSSLRQYEPIETDEAFAAVFGSAKLSVALFDCWWSIRGFRVDDTVEHMQNWVSRCGRSIEPTGNPVTDRWIGWVVDRG